MQVKKSPLHDRHVAEGAKMVEFAGYIMPLEYRGIMAEHEVVRTKAGLFDLTHMGVIEIRGERGFGFIQRLITNDISKIPVGGILYTPVCNEDGGILDDILVYRMKDRFMLIVNAANKDKIYRWILDKECSIDSGNNKVRCLTIDKSDKIAILAVQGPKAGEIVQRITPVDLPEIEYYHFKQGRILDTTGIISRTGYTGEDGFELYISREEAVPIWDALLVEGEGYGLQPVGLGARDTLRLEAKYALYGNELSENVNPIEAGLKWTVSMEKPYFMGREAIQRILDEKPSRKLIGFELSKPGIARKDCPVLNSAGEEVGMVTSGTFSPTLRKAIGLALVKRKGMKVGTPIRIQVRKRKIPAVIVKTPFYRGSVKSKHGGK